uniref:protein terminal ear1 homolog n=1 Tax=Erigeron canadensis TaxID=72917 RepID=UPI001CB8CD63|nr:protein terminal ear1 homolog [Erigeron canadensis]
MTDAGFRHFPFTLDPFAQEFWPTHNNPIVFHFPAPPPPPPPPPLPPPSTVPTRSLLLSLVPITVSESIVRRDLEVFGDVRAVQMERLRDGILTVHFYDLRQAVKALDEIKKQHMQQQCRLRKHFDGLLMSLSPVNNFVPPLPSPSPARGLLAGRAIWAQFTFPVSGGFPDGYNQGTVVVFNLGSDVSNCVIREIFEPFGCVKEIRDNKKNKKFVEFYDTRDAAKAVIEVNGQEIRGKPVVVEFSRPGGLKNNYKLNKFLPISPGGVPVRPLVPPYRALPMSLSNDNVNSPPGGVKKNGKNLIKHQLPIGEQNGRCGSGGERNNKQWKGSRYTREKCDVRFLMKEDDVVSSFKDLRTTVMIKNIPNKYSQKLLLNMLDNHCIQCNEQVEAGEDNLPLSSYDFVYLPIDFVNKCNVGYGFVNMTTPEATWRLHKAFHHRNWEVFNSKKICEISYARLQGLEALKDHFKNSKFPREAEEYMPVVFTPPRDGRIVSDPTPIIGRGGSSNSNSIATTTVTSSSSSSLTSEDQEGGDELDLMVDNSRSFYDDDNLLVVEDTKSDIVTITSR